eukprot:CAMPEP_0202454840 /NCGR_PEP_ID=MMETSP1360-20130828/12478_1 /ASSEMBLY_ACC=CAM_ASM_000848 /TAXON_ID=515479 /ORGANISM="Licmophora paradoxa, Strain CCMP2313" /LENGTH=337 /DNA_ID=CAMNT_0049074253 /DNA_START=47 /DNA_END=1060 /DNA_ORIENTATION=+
MFFSGFSASKLKPQLKMAVSRFQIASNKKTALMKQQMREIGVMLAEDPPREEKARIRAEALIREDNAVEAYEILQLECELLAERIKLLEATKTCPPDLVSCISTLIWTCDRVDISELSLIKKQFRSKYGKKFEENAQNNVGGVLNERVVSKLSIQPPAAYLVQVYLERICEQFEVDWKPKVPVQPDNMAQPMAAPVGYSVQIAGASGLGEVTTGTMSSDQEIGISSKADIPAAPMGSAIPPSATATRMDPSIPSVTAQPMGSAQPNDFDEPDIFIPAIPVSPPTVSNNNKGSGPLPPTPPSGYPGTSNNNKPSAPPPGDDGGQSYRDLAARFNSLKK